MELLFAQYFGSDVLEGASAVGSRLSNRPVGQINDKRCAVLFVIILDNYNSEVGTELINAIHVLTEIINFAAAV